MLSGHAHHRSTLAAGCTQKVWCMWRLCVLYSAVCLSLWQPSEAARPLCGSDLLANLIFVCGDRGIYLGSRGRGSWSGYGFRPRSKGIADHCCSAAGCDLQLLEKYCDKPKKPDGPAPTTVTTTTTTMTTTTTTTPPTPTTTTTTTTTSSTPTATFTPPTTALQFAALFQKRLLQHLGPPNSQRRSSARRKTHNSPRRRKLSASSRRGAARQRPASKSVLGPQKPKLS